MFVLKWRRIYVWCKCISNIYQKIDRITIYTLWYVSNASKTVQRIVLRCLSAFLGNSLVVAEVGINEPQHVIISYLIIEQINIQLS